MNDEHWWNHPAFLWSCVVAGILVVLAALVLAVAWIGNGVSRHSNDVNCRKLHESSGYETKFDPQGFWSSGVCYVQTEDGRWVPRELFYYEASRPGR